MTATPVLFMIAPMIQLFVANATGNTAHLNTRIGLSLLYMPVIAVSVPAIRLLGGRGARAGHARGGPDHPIRRAEFLIAKPLAAFVPTLVVASSSLGSFSPLRLCSLIL